jgi:hypothetical protein
VAPDRVCQELASLDAAGDVRDTARALRKLRDAAQAAAVPSFVEMSLCYIYIEREREREREGECVAER